MVSALSPLQAQTQPVDIAGSLLGGRQAFQESQLNQQAMQQNAQQIERADYERAIERLKVINRLAIKVRQLKQNERQGFVGSINQNMLQSVGIDPATVSSVPLDDQSLDALIAQTGAAIPESAATAGQREFESLTAGLSPEERERARRIELGLDPRAVGSANITTATTGLTEDVARSQSEIEAAKSSAREGAKLDVQAEKLPAVTSAVTAAREQAENEAAAADRAAKSREEGLSALPKLEAQADESIRLIDELLAHPGRNIATGTTAWVPAVPGTKQADFINRFDQIKGQAFLQAFESLKGGGAITEIEGKAATQAINRLNRATTKQEFDAAANDLKKVLQNAKSVAAKKAGKTDTEPSLEDLLSKY